MSIAWDATTSSAAHLDRAKKAANVAGFSRDGSLWSVIRDIEHEVESDAGVLATLLDRRNWIVARPALHIRATVNQLGSVICDWRPVEGRVGDFACGLAGQALAGTSGGPRPINELMWVRGFKSLYSHNPGLPSDVCTALRFAVRAQFEQITRDIAAVMDISPPLRHAFNWETGQVE